MREEMKELAQTAKDRDASLQALQAAYEKLNKVRRRCGRGGGCTFARLHARHRQGLKCPVAHPCRR